MHSISDPFNRRKQHADLSPMQLEHCREAQESKKTCVKLYSSHICATAHLAH